MIRRTPLKRVSDKRRAEMKEYAKLRAEFLKANPVCQLCGKAKATDVHHKCKRGKNYLNVATWAALDRKCHTYIEDHKSWARTNGWLEY